MSAALTVLLVCWVGLGLHSAVVSVGLAEPLPSSRHAFYRLYGLHEAPALWLLGAFAVLALFATPAASIRLPHLHWLSRASAVLRYVRPPSIVLAALAVLALTAVGTFAVMQGIGLSMDEAAASFQARIFAAGRLTAPIPSEWRSLAPWMTPVFITLKGAEQAWVATYLPVYAAIRAGFSLVHAEWLTNPALAAATVALLLAAGRRVWPANERRHWLAVLFLVTSTQFLVTSMSGYSMPAHLCLNVLWLYLYARDDARGWAVAPWIGILALGLHNPFPHALFVAPFFVRLLRRRRFAWSGYFAAVYLAGAALWYHWLLAGAWGADPASAAGGQGVAGSAISGMLASFDAPNRLMLYTQGMNLALLASWQTPVLAFFVAVAGLSWRKLAAHEQDLALGLFATFAFYFFFPSDQGHGWGYRYTYGVLANLVLLAAVGADVVWRARRDALVGWLVGASVAATVFVQLPLRLRQVERFVRPFAAALDHIAARPERLVLVDVSAAWYARDLVRNDPLFRRGPVAAGFVPGRGPNLRDVPEAARHSVYVVGRAELARLGLTVFAPR
jgi:hypothetical protein